MTHQAEWCGGQGFRCVVTLGLLALVGLAAPGPAWGQAAKTGKQWQGIYSSVEKPQRVVVRDRDKWSEVWKAGNGTVSPLPELPKIDFDNQMVLAVFTGNRNTGGHAVEVVKVKDDGKRLTATVRETKPRPGRLVPQVITSPYCFVVVPRSEAVTFVSE